MRYKPLDIKHEKNIVTFNYVELIPKPRFQPRLEMLLIAVLPQVLKRSITLSIPSQRLRTR